MNGPEHYREAERLLDEVHKAVQAFPGNTIADPRAQQMYGNIVARAQVHATLAQVAATIDAAQSATLAVQWTAGMRAS
jgi:hypothetical protein